MTVNIEPAKVETIAAGGATITDLCHALGISRDTWYRRIKTETELQEAYERGEGKGAVVAQQQIMSNIKSGNQRAAEYFLNNRRPKEWSSRRALELTGPDGEPLDLNWTVELVEPVHEDTNE